MVAAKHQGRGERGGDGWRQVSQSGAGSEGEEPSPGTTRRGWKGDDFGLPCKDHNEVCSLRWGWWLVETVSSLGGPRTHTVGTQEMLVGIYGHIAVDTTVPALY